MCLVLKSVIKGREKGDKRKKFSFFFLEVILNDYSISILHTGQNERHSDLRPKESKKLGKQVLFRSLEKMKELKACNIPFGDRFLTKPLS